MKPIFKATLFAAGILTSLQACTQHDDSNVRHKVDKTTAQLGHETSEFAANAAAAITDKKYQGKIAPGGETVYIDGHAHYYYINKLGHKVYINKSSLLNKPSE